MMTFSKGDGWVTEFGHEFAIFDGGSSVTYYCYSCDTRLNFEKSSDFEAMRKVNLYCFGHLLELECE